MKSLNKTIGIIRSIYIAAKAGDPMLKCAQVQAEKGQGLIGDRYASNIGFWQKTPKQRVTIRDVSFISLSDIEGSGFLESETRRNIVVETDYKLTQLIDKNFYVGNVLFRGIEECTPCKRPSELSGKNHFAQKFKNKGGLRAQILSSGLIQELDLLVVVK